MKTRFAIPALLLVSLAAISLTGCQSATTTTPPQKAAAGSPAKQVLPVNSNPIANASTTPGLTIVSAAVQDNMDPVTKASISDRLQITIHNDTASALTGFEVYYSMKDVTTGMSEGYYQALTGLSVPAKGDTTIYFDGETGPGHYPENPFSIYRSSSNQVDFMIEVSAAGVQIAHGTASKAVGTGEVVGG